MGMEANSTCTGLMLEKDRWRPPSQNRSFAVPEVGRVAQPDRAQPSKLRGAGSSPAAVASKEVKKKPCLAEQARVFAAHRARHDARLKEIVSLNAVTQVARWVERANPPRSGRATPYGAVVRAIAWHLRIGGL